MPTNLSVISRTFSKEKWKKDAYGFGRKKGFKRMVEIKQKNGVKNESIQEIMRQT